MTEEFQSVLTAEQQHEIGLLVATRIMEKAKPLTRQQQLDIEAEMDRLIFSGLQ